MPVRGDDIPLAVSFNDMAEPVPTDRPAGGVRQPTAGSPDVSHELRTPLTTVRMAADLIYDHSADLDHAAAVHRVDG